jgi:hypothetical protein
MKVGSLVKCLGDLYVVLGTEKDSKGETMLSVLSLNKSGWHMMVKLEGNPWVEVVSANR